MKSKRGKSKTKKAKGAALMRTDVWHLVFNQQQKEMMLMTIAEYRKYLFPLVLIVNAQWVKLASLSSNERLNTVEKMIHSTEKNPNPKHRYYQQIVSKYPSHLKFPSYLRRAAIADAIGIVSSFQTRYRSWQSGDRKKRTSKPPKLTAMCKTYPTLYKGQQVLYGTNYQICDLKVWNGSDWIWLPNLKIKTHGNKRHLVDGNQLMSPTLVVNKNKCQLSMPVKIKPIKREDIDYVCSIDLGINNAATASIVGSDGTVKARIFINAARDIDRRNKRRMMIAKKSKQTCNLTSEKLPRGFCRGLYRKSSHQNLEIARTVVKQIIELASAHGVSVIVIENLAGWKAKAGKKGSLMKQKFHLWCHRKIVELLTDRWQELGGKVQTINPKYTSAYAFDGSGKVRRSKTNYSLAKFRNGKQYNCDLNASYNIGARYWYCLFVGDKTFSRVFDSKSSDDTLRTPIVLGTLRNLCVS
jgi:IS605 OrfB family transposase